mmetsp:Transcript_16574/g.50877  ORF Transcript_16574/g.50877 Transcript_16574/m.50877 type:complete len:218 (+) Transcript_16574:412-1065(+)
MTKSSTVCSPSSSGAANSMVSFFSLPRVTFLMPSILSLWPTRTNQSSRTSSSSSSSSSKPPISNMVRSMEASMASPTNSPSCSSASPDAAAAPIPRPAPGSCTPCKLARTLPKPDVHEDMAPPPFAFAASGGFVFVSALVSAEACCWNMVPIVPIPFPMAPHLFFKLARIGLALAPSSAAPASLEAAPATGAAGAAAAFFKLDTFALLRRFATSMRA